VPAGASQQSPSAGLTAGTTSQPAAVANEDDAHARLKSAAIDADEKSQALAEKFRGSLKSKKDLEKARALLKPMVVDAFRTKQQFHIAQLDAMQERVIRLERLVTARQKAEAEIIDRRVDELLNPDLRWNAVTSKVPAKIEPSLATPRPVTASRTRHFWVEADPFGGPTVSAAFLEEIAKDAETIYRVQTRECFDQDPVAFAELCGIDVTIDPNGNSNSHTTYRFASDGRVDSAMMHLQGRQDQFDGMLRHEVMHLILAAQFKTALPRWIDEGLALQHESDEVVSRMKDRITHARTANELISLKELFRMKSYPREPKQITLMYAQAYSVVDWLITRGGKRKLLQCLQSVEPTAMADQLPEAIVKAYRFEDLADLENQWRESL
jgi:hypothetical protein